MTGFLGLSRIEGNVLFNGCRESDDHGNFNSVSSQAVYRCS